MKKKQLFGLILGVVGIAISIYAIYNMKRIADAKGTIHELTHPFSNNQSGKYAEDALMHKASEHDMTVTILLVGGIVMIIIGGVMLCANCRKGHR